MEPEDLLVVEGEAYHRGEEGKMISGPLLEIYHPRNLREFIRMLKRDGFYYLNKIEFEKENGEKSPVADEVPMSKLSKKEIDFSKVFSK